MYIQIIFKPNNIYSLKVFIFQVNLIIGVNLSIMQYGLLNDLPQNNFFRCSSLTELR